MDEFAGADQTPSKVIHRMLGGMRRVKLGFKRILRKTAASKETCPF